MPTAERKAAELLPQLIIPDEYVTVRMGLTIIASPSWDEMEKALLKCARPTNSAAVTPIAPAAIDKKPARKRISAAGRKAIQEANRKRWAAKKKAAAEAKSATKVKKKKHQAHAAAA